MSLAVVCASCHWATAAMPQLDGICGEGDDKGAFKERIDSLVREVIRTCFDTHDVASLRVRRGEKVPSCMVPVRVDASSASTSPVASIVDGEMLLAAAEFFAQVSAGVSSRAPPDGVLKADVRHAASLVEGIVRAGSMDMWSVQSQVRWLTVAVAALHSMEPDSVSTVTSAIVESLHSLPVHTLVLHSPTIFCSLHRLLETGQADLIGSIVSSFACRVASEVNSNLFRLSLADAHGVVDGSLRVANLLPLDDAMRSEAASLFVTAVDSLPAKFRAEQVFHRRRDQAIDTAVVGGWCSLLSSDTTQPVAEAVWEHLAKEAVQLVDRGELDNTIADILSSFMREGLRRKWDPADVSSPLGSISASVVHEWRRNVARDGELEDPEHEPVPIAAETADRLRELFRDLPHQSP